jgi:branched-chain amino acid transport system ATP-binding protein
VHVLKGISLHVRPGELVALIGANGAGKTTTLKTISGLVKARRGEVGFRGAGIAGLAPNRIVRKGLSHVPEGRQIFAKMTVCANLELGGYLLRDREAVKERIENLTALFPILGERKDQLAGTLSGGEQQMLAIGRALMTNPDLLLMDEPAEGLAPMLVEIVEGIILRLKKENHTILLVEQNMPMALKVADIVHVLSRGRMVYSSSPSELWENEEVKSTYLGV